MKVILGKKLNMTQIFLDDGTVVPVTLVEAGPCTVTDVKNAEKDSYNAVVLGFGIKKTLNKPQREAWKDLGAFAYVREFSTNDAVEAKCGDIVDVSTFEVGDSVDVVGTSKGRGFQGVVKRHGFKGSPASHGHKDQLRMPGSIGTGGVQRVFKGMRMPGRMGADRVTVQNLRVVSIDPKKNIIAIKGAVPGAYGSLLMIRERVGKNAWGN